MRSELSGVAEQCLFGDTQYYNVLISSHGMLMIFWFVMPVLIGGFGNLYVPSMLGVPELLFPRLNNMALLMLGPGYNLLIMSTLCDEGSGTG